MALVGFAVIEGRSPALVHACSAGSDFNAVTESEVIVEGRITRWHPTDHQGLPATWTFSRIQLEMQVTKTHKGDTGSEISFTDAASLSNSGQSWAGGSGACGAFDQDPTDAYVILGLNRSEDGTLATNRLQTFYIGEEPAGERYESALRRLQGLSAVRPPLTGYGPPYYQESKSSLEKALPVAGFIALALAGAVVLRERKTA